MSTTNLTAAHPTPDELRRFLCGELTEADSERLAGHLPDCPSCRQTLAEQGQADELLQGLRQPLLPEPHSDEPQCAEALARLTRSFPAVAVSPSTAGGDTPAPVVARSPVGRVGNPSDAVFGTLPCDFGRYRVLSRLGRGGMGAVYLAEDTVLQRQVALKVAHFQSDLESAPAQRFLREARTAAGLEHEGICRVLDYGVCNGIHFFTMEHVRGQPLTALVAEGQPLAPRRAAALVREVALALDVAHRQGVVHRDLKPANIMLASGGHEASGGREPPGSPEASGGREPPVGRPKVVDFGLARVAEDPGLTETGAVVGTLRYMSPEQVDGQEVGPASDVYSLGVVLYELLTGRLPYQGATRSAIVHAIAQQPPEPPSRHRPGLDARLEAVCLKALAKTPADRFATMADLAAALQEYLDGAAALPPHVNEIPRRRRLVALTALAAATLLLAAGLGIAAWYLTRERGAAGTSPTLPADTRREPLNGWVDVRVWRPDLPPGLDLGLHDGDTLPLTALDKVSVEVQLNQPAYLYVVWIDRSGQVSPVYPWRPGRWEERPEHEQAVARIRRPEAEDKYWPMKKGQPGMETLLLLAREEPWPADVDLHGLLNGLPEQTLQNAAAAVWFENWRVVKDEPKRSPNFFDEQRAGDPVLQTQRLLQERLGKYCDYSRAVSFANRGR